MDSYSTDSRHLEQPGMEYGPSLDPFDSVDRTDEAANGADGAKAQVTEYTLAFDTLRQSEARFRAVWGASADAMALSDPVGTVLDANRAYLQLYGYAYEEVVGQNFAVIFPEDAKASANEQYRNIFYAREVPPPFEGEIRRKDGTLGVVESRIDFIEEDGVRVAMLSSIRDITDRIRNEAALRESEERFRQTFENAPIGMALVGLDLKPLKVNQALCRLLGYNEEELSHLSAVDITYPDDLQVDQDLAELLLRGNIPSYSIEKRYIGKGGEIIWAQLSVTLIRDDAGNILYGLAMLEDITQRKRADEERISILASEKDARVVAERAVRAQEELLSVVSHDLSNPIMVMKGVTQLLERRIAKGHLPDHEQLSRLATQFSTAIERMEGFIRDLSSSQQIEPGRALSMNPERLDLVALARQVANSHQEQTQRHQIQVVADREELFGLWDSGRLEQVLDNLVSNAIKYSPHGGAVNIAVAYEQRGKSDPAHGVKDEPQADKSHSRHAVIKVSDEGMGIPADELPFVFEWYRRATNVKGLIDGTGVGLAGALQIVEQHGGSIAVESTEGVGSTFTVLLPLRPASFRIASDLS